MVRLREVPRTAPFAWSPGSAAPLIATGSKYGAFDENFSNETRLEIWNTALDDPDQGAELEPSASVTVESGYDEQGDPKANLSSNDDNSFHDITWGHLSSDRPWGVIAGGLEESVDLWDADALLKGSKYVKTRTWLGNPNRMQGPAHLPLEAS